MSYQPRLEIRKTEFFDKSVLPTATSVFLLFIAYGGITSFVPLFADSIKVNSSGTFFLIYAATLVLIRPFAGKLSDTKGETFVIIPTLVVTILALLVLAFSTNFLGIIFSAILYGIGFGSAQPAFQAAMISLVNQEKTGVANASFSTATDLGIGLGAMILGWVSEYTSFRVMFTVSAVSVVFSLLAFILLVRRLLIKQSLSTSKHLLSSKNTG
jgi:MFS family permease